jgi:hypothetical protein
MNKYHLEVIGSSWPSRTVLADRVEFDSMRYEFTKFNSSKSEWTLVSSYPVSKTIITEVEYNIEENEI